MFLFAKEQNNYKKIRLYDSFDSWNFNNWR